MAWRFVFREILPRDGSPVDYIMPSFMKPEYDTYMYLTNYTQMDYLSPKYKSKDDMLADFDALVDLTGQKPICNFYKGNKYITNGVELYKLFVLERSGFSGCVCTS